GIRQEHQGLAAARNRGYAEADPNPEFVTFLDANGIWEPRALALLRDTLRQLPGAAAAHGLVTAIDQNSEPRFPGHFESCGYRRESVVGRHLRSWQPESPTLLSM